jgi:hypothetical protein
MSDVSKIQNFVFRGLLLDSSLGTFADSGLDVRGEPVEKREGNRISIDDFPMDLRMDAVKTSHVYIAFFCFENSVRKLVSERLLERNGVKWWEKCVSEKIKKRVTDRMDKDKKNKWHAPRATNEIAYCDFGDLNDIILTRWSDFEDLFPTQDWVKTRLGDLEQSRNALAHSNVLSDHDIDRIDMFLQDWVLQVG